MSAGHLHALRADVPEAAVTLALDAMEGLALSSTVYEIDETKKQWQVTWWFGARPEQGEIESRLAVLGVVTSVALKAQWETVSPEAWRALLKQDFPPLVIGDTVIAASDWAEELPSHRHLLRIDAGLAFGTGEHYTTRGCVRVLQLLAQSRTFENILDMGCGTAILAMAAAQRWHVPVLAADIDAMAVRVAEENVRRNRLRRWIRTVVSDGYASAVVQRGAPYDLVIANILALPLIAQAKDLARALAPDGVAVLSGFTRPQANAVLAAHRLHGMRLKAKLFEGEWCIMVLER